MIAALLDRPNEPVNEFTYFDCMDTIVQKSKLLEETGTLITTHAKNVDYDQFGKVVNTTSEAVCQLTEAAAQVCHHYPLSGSHCVSFVTHCVGSLLDWHS